MPKLRFDEFETRWNPVKLGDITSYLKGFAFKSNDYLDSGGLDSRLIRVSDLSSDSVKVDNKKVFLPTELVDRSIRYKLKNGDVLITTVGSKPELRESAVGRAIYINEAHGVLNQNLLIMRPNNENTSKFIFSQLNTPRYIDHVTNIQRGNANQSNITVADLFEYRVSTTTLPEQQKIASFLSKVDEKIALLSEKEDKLTEYKRGVMQQLFNSKWQEQDGQLTFMPPTLRFKAGDGSEFPDWEEREFDDIFNFSTGKNIKQNEASPEFDTPCVRYGELYHMYGEVITTVVNSTNLEHSELTFSNGNEILLPSAGEDPLDIGSASALTLSDVAIGRTINVLRPKGSIDYCPVYVSFYINEKLRKKISTLARGASISNVYNSDLRGLSLPLPSIKEQYVIKSFLLKIEDKLKLTNSELEKAKEWKRGLLQQMFV
ncbi:restriction endonuclease subunit S [Vibrio lentus]|nr:restriction endonuclease subunit S [Vibrio lentus]MCC4792464.1 restriction endonuclease subunit S [Vibrio lentus]MCC4849276.1 restriction endonuclease subunit S [Vibrio lentus]